MKSQEEDKDSFKLPRQELGYTGLNSLKRLAKQLVNEWFTEEQLGSINSTHHTTVHRKSMQCLAGGPAG